MIDWRGEPDWLLGEREDRVLEIKLHTDGTWRLFVTKPTGSMIVGVYSAPEIARYAGENMPLDDASLAKLATDPYPATRFADNASG